MFMFKFVNGDVIESIKYMFSINKEIHDHFTRQSNKLRVPKCNKTTIQTNVRFRGVKIWNYICNVVYYDCSLSCFKCNLKGCLIHCSPYNQIHSCISSWWRHHMETFSALLALSEGNSPVPGEFPLHRPVTWSFDVFFDQHLNKRLSKHSRRLWFETPSRSLWRHCNVRLMNWCLDIIFENLCKYQECQFVLWLLAVICTFICICMTTSTCIYDVWSLKDNLHFNFYFSRSLCFLQLLLRPPCFCPVTVIQCTYVLMLIFEPHLVYFNKPHSVQSLIVIMGYRSTGCV